MRECVCVYMRVLACVHCLHVCLRACIVYTPLALSSSESADIVSYARFMVACMWESNDKKEGGISHHISCSLGRLGERHRIIVSMLSSTS